jgi:outer membrane protein OmpA-like peptidoglycan-associated protein
MRQTTFDNRLKLLNLVVLSVAFASCTPRFKLGQSSLSFQKPAEPVTLHGEQFGLRLNYQIAPNVFSPKGIAVVRLIQANGDTKTELAREILVGNKVQNLKGRKISQQTGGDGEISFSATYHDEISTLEYWLEVTSFDNSKKTIKANALFLEKGTVFVPSPDNAHSFKIKVTDGVSLLSRTAFFNTMPQPIDPLFIADTIEPFVATIYFEVNKSVIRESERKRKEIEQLVNFLSKTKEILRIEVNGFASPDGEFEFNNDLADERATEAGKFVVQSLQSSQSLKDIQFDLNNAQLYVQNKGTEDWNGLLRGIEFAHIPEKESVKRIIENRSLSSREKQAQLQNMRESWKIIAEDYLPPLRRANMIINTKVAPRTFVERLQLIRAKSTGISASEMLASAEQTSDPLQKAEILEAAKRMYPADHRSYNNLAVLDIQNGSIETASRNLDAAAEASPGSAEILHNQAYVACLTKNWPKLGIVLKRARGNSQKMPEYEGLHAIIGGKYDEAISALSPKGPSFLLSLAFCLNRDYPAAFKSLKNLDRNESAVLYLSAVIAARTGDTAAVERDLTAFASMNPQAKSNMSTDPEFALFRQENFFKNLIR